MGQINSSSTRSWQESLVASLDVGVVIINSDFSIQEWNQFMVNHTGVDTSNAQGSSLFNVAGEIEQKWFENKCKPVFELNTPVFVIWEQREFLFEMKVLRPVTSSAENMYQNITILPISDNDGNVEKACILVYDVTDHALSKIRVQNLNEQLKEISRIDGLTGLYNRRYWQERFELEYKLTFRTRAPVSVLILDIDHFKSVNDNYGHQAGDTVIKRVASIILEQTRETDVAGRYGGEEFVVILPDTNSQNATIVAERIRKEVMHCLIEHDMSEMRVTVSLGIAGFDENYSTPTQWLEAADAALYKAKNSGRNNTQLA